MRALGGHRGERRRGRCGACLELLTAKKPSATRSRAGFPTHRDTATPGPRHGIDMMWARAGGLSCHCFSPPRHCSLQPRALLGPVSRGLARGRLGFLSRPPSFVAPSVHLCTVHISVSRLSRKTLTSFPRLFGPWLVVGGAPDYSMRFLSEAPPRCAARTRPHLPNYANTSLIASLLP